jgi:cytochrome c oxidase cbb3-type subunit 1
MTTENQRQGVQSAVAHALAWLVIGNAIGVFLSILLLFPHLNLGELTYGRWASVHLNAQLYGWTALPLIAWLFSVYEVHRGKSATWAIPAVWAWSGALMIGSISWLSGTSSGKIFLDWRNGSLWVFVASMFILWLVLATAWKEGVSRWTRLRKWLSGIVIVGLAFVPISMIFAASPSIYPPVDHTTGGPTGSSLLGSTLIVVGMMLFLPRIAGLPAELRASRLTWIFFGFCWLVFIVTEAIGGSHFDYWQIGAMLCLVPWAWLIPKDWKKFTWPEGTISWRIAAMSWWGILVISGVTMFFPSLLDHLKFTQGLVAHSHLAMAGFTTSFCALLIVAVSGKKLGGNVTIPLWNAAALGMIVVLAWMGWREGDEYSWMISNPTWRQIGFILRMIFGTAMLTISVVWFTQWIRK